MAEDIEYLDCKHLQCPMPIVTLTKKISSMAAGTKIRIEAQDPTFKLDLEIWAKKHGHCIIDFAQEGTIQSAIIQKK